MDLTKLIRSGSINHNPQDCPMPYACNYLISIANPDLSGPQKYTFKIRTSVEPLPIILFQQYQDSVNYHSYSYFQIKFNPNQLRRLEIKQILINLTSFIGMAEVYASTSNKYPSSSNYEYSSSQIFPFNQIVIDT